MGGDQIKTIKYTDATGRVKKITAPYDERWYSRSRF